MIGLAAILLVFGVNTMLLVIGMDAILLVLEEATHGSWLAARLESAEV